MSNFILLLLTLALCGCSAGASTAVTGAPPAPNPSTLAQAARLGATDEATGADLFGQVPPKALAEPEIQGAQANIAKANQIYNVCRLVGKLTNFAEPKPDDLPAQLGYAKGYYQTTTFFSPVEKYPEKNETNPDRVLKLPPTEIIAAVGVERAAMYSYFAALQNASVLVTAGALRGAALRGYMHAALYRLATSGYGAADVKLLSWTEQHCGSIGAGNVQVGPRG